MTSVDGCLFYSQDCCRFAAVIVGSESSSRMIFDKLPQKDMHGMLPSVHTYTMASLAKLDPSRDLKKDSAAAGGGLSCAAHYLH